MGALCMMWQNYVVFKYILRPHEEVQGKYYTLMDVPVHSEQIEPSFIFIASFSRKL